MRIVTYRPAILPGIPTSVKYRSFLARSQLSPQTMKETDYSKWSQEKLVERVKALDDRLEQLEALVIK